MRSFTLEQETGGNPCILVIASTAPMFPSRNINMVVLHCSVSTNLHIEFVVKVLIRPYLAGGVGPDIRGGTITL
jgi:hypothetical protein